MKKENIKYQLKQIKEDIYMLLGDIKILVYEIFRIK